MEEMTQKEQHFLFYFFLIETKNLACEKSMSYKQESPAVNTIYTRAE